MLREQRETPDVPVVRDRADCGFQENARAHGVLSHRPRLEIPGHPFPWPRDFPGVGDRYLNDRVSVARSGRTPCRRCGLRGDRRPQRMSCVWLTCCDAVSGLRSPLLGYVHMSTGTYLTCKTKTLENPAVALVRPDLVARHSVRDTPGAADYDHVQGSLGSVPIHPLARPKRDRSVPLDMKPSKTVVAIPISLLLLAAVVTLRNPDANGAPARAAAAELVVSSARDAGPQTLRDAILAADRLSGRAHILVTAKLIALASPLPALVNPRGVDIEAAADSGTLDADHLASGVVLQINSPGSTLKGLHIVHAHGTAILVNAADVQLDSVIIGDSKAGILVNAAARGCAIRASTFERDETGVIAEAGVRDLTVAGGVFRDNTRAGIWSVAATGKGATAPDPGTEGNRPQEPVRIIDGVFERNASGVVIANQPAFLHKDRFLGSHDSAVLILSGAARIEDSEIRDSGGTALSVTAGKSVHLTHNTFANNPKVAIMMSDSDVTIENNTLSHNGFGIVSILTQGSLTPQIRGNLITGTTGDGITVIGGSPRLERNQVLDGHSAGLRLLDVVQPNGGLKATPTLEANVFKGNALDQPVHGVYKMPGAP
ncbi:MAG: hypothetical protein E6K31_00460 [Gammaproteobacteria bacterium]|nr:MAG: hypothetical protein E6K31_00460 [Gammaproteobacteria bacterium]